MKVLRLYGRMVVYDKFKAREVEKVNQYYIENNMINTQKMIEESEDKALES